MAFIVAPQRFPSVSSSAWKTWLNSLNSAVKKPNLSVPCAPFCAFVVKKIVASILANSYFLNWYHIGQKTQKHGFMISKPWLHLWSIYRSRLQPFSSSIIIPPWKKHDRIPLKPLAGIKKTKSSALCATSCALWLKKSFAIRFSKTLFSQSVSF